MTKTKNKNKSELDFALVTMPYGALSQPSLATGLLKACLLKEGYSCKVVPATLQFCEDVGLIAHNLLFGALPHSMIGEWTFSSALFPGYEPGGDKLYLDRTVAMLKVESSLPWREIHHSNPGVDVRKLMREIRDYTPGFVDRIARQVLDLNPRIVGCSSAFQQHCASLALLRRIKQLSPTTVTIIGGSNCEGGLGKATFDLFPWLDYVVSGDADGFIASLTNDILTHNGSIPEADLPMGVYGRGDKGDRVYDYTQDTVPYPEYFSALEASLRSIEGDGAVPCKSNGCQESDPSEAPVTEQSKDEEPVFVKNESEGKLGPIATMTDLDQVPIPDYDDWFEALGETQYGHFLAPSLPYMTSRGCWWGEKHQCTFCGISDEAMKYRAKSADLIMSEFFQLKEKYGINSFQGTEYIIDQKYFKTLIPRLHTLKSMFRFEVKATLRDHHVKALRDAGVAEIQPGVESLHDDALLEFNKGTTGAANIRLLKSGRRHGISVFWNLLHSFPNDQDEWYQEQAEILPLLQHLQPPAAFAFIHYDRFGKYWKKPEDYGLNLVPAWGYKQVYPFGQEDLLNMAYFHDNTNENDKAVKTMSERPGLRALQKAVADWRTSFRRPGARDNVMCTIEYCDDHGIVTDTRDIAVEESTTLRGLHYEIIKACENPSKELSMPREVSKAIGREVEWEELQPIVEDLMKRKLLAKVCSWYVAVTVVGPVRTFISDEVDAAPELNPDVGIIEADRFMAKQTLVSRCVRAPHEIPVTELFARNEIEAAPVTVGS